MPLHKVIFYLTIINQMNSKSQELYNIWIRIFYSTIIIAVIINYFIFFAEAIKLYLLFQ